MRFSDSKLYMIKRLIELIRENRRNQKDILRYSQELNWKNVFRDSIRGKDRLEKLPLNIGRWGCNYAFLYTMNRILEDFSPKRILELGLGESTKFISTFLEMKILDCHHLVIEQDQNWKNFYIQNNDILRKTEIKICPIVKRYVKGFETNVYKGFDKLITQKFDLYIVDGPIGTKHFSRYDILSIGRSLEIGDEFIIVVDDYERLGERETIEDLRKVFEIKNIDTYETVYYGLKQILIIASEKYKYTRSF